MLGIYCVQTITFLAFVGGQASASVSRPTRDMKPRPKPNYWTPVIFYFWKITILFIIQLWHD